MTQAARPSTPTPDRSPEAPYGLFERVAHFLLGHARAALAVAVAVALAGAWFGADLPIRLSIVDLLPPDRESVRDFTAVAKEVGGIGYLGVMIGPLDEPEKRLPELAELLRSRDDIKYVFYEREEHVMAPRALYLLPRTAFDDLVKAVTTLVHGGGTTGFIDLGVDTPEERAANEADARATIDRLRGAHLGGTKTSSATNERASRYFLSDDGRYAMLFAKPTFDSMDLGRSATLVSTVQRQLDGAMPKDVPFALWGRFVNQVGDAEQIRKDIGIASILSVVLLVAVLIVGLGSVRSALITVGGMLLSMGWTAGFAHFVVGQINVITGFMVAILSGLGVEYGIHLVRRYRTERDAGLDHAAALETTYLTVGRALLSAALTSAGAFLILAFSDFRGFSELGYIAGFGILSIYVVYLLAFPALSRFIPDRARFGRIEGAIGWYGVRRGWVWLVPVLVAAGLCGVTRAELELDLQRMRRLSDDTQKRSAIVGELMKGKSTTPAGILATSREEAEQVRAAMREPPYDSRVRNAVSLESVVPSDQAERAKKLAPLRKALRRASDGELRTKLGLDPAQARKWIEATPFTVADLPPQIAEAFGPKGSVVVIYSDDREERIEDIYGYADLLRSVKTKFPDVKLGSDVIVLSEIIRYVLDDGRIVAVLFLLGVLVVLWLDLRSMKEAIVLEAQLVSGIALLIGLMGLAKVPFTVINVAMVPAVLAAGIDMGVHVRHAELEHGASPVEGARTVARAVHLGVLTTLVGFGSLFVTRAEMLRGIAWVSCLGQLSMYLVCMVAFPLAKEALRRRSAR